jgi:predicted TIM-barrel enzyme
MTSNQDVFHIDPLIITALHLPQLRHMQNLPMSWLEDYVFQNLSVFVKGGIPAVILQEETLNTAQATPESVAVLSVLASKAHLEFPEIELGIIMQAHDGISPLAVAHASGASFVRLKVFVGAMLKSEGIQQGCGIAARNYREKIGREDIKILADVHDRTGLPVTGIPIEMASEWAVQTGADGLILTGFSIEESIQYFQNVRKAGISAPLILGGGATEENVARVLEYADGVIVSSALKYENPDPKNIVLWDIDLVKRFLDCSRKKPGK